MMAVDTPVEELVSLANKASREGRIGDEADAAFHEIANYVDRHTDVWELEADTLLSSREAEVVVLKKLGLTHNAIRYYFVTHGGVVRASGDDPGITSVGTVDKYSRRAMDKYERALATVEALENLY